MIAMSISGQKGYSLLRRGAFVLWLLLAFLIIFGVACLVAFNSYNKAIHAAVRSNETRATLLSKLILEHQRAAIGVLRSYAGRLSFVNSVKKKNVQGVVRHLADLVKNNSEAEWPFVANPDSSLWANFPVDKRSINKNFSDRDWYQGVSNGWKPHISSVFKLVVGEQDLAVAISVPIFDEKGETIGILSNSQTTAFFRNIIGEADSDSDALTTLIDQKGLIIYSNRFPYTKEPIDYPAPGLVAKAVKQGKGHLEVRDSSDGGRIKYVSFVHIGEIGWSVVVEKKKTDVLRSEFSYFGLIAVASLLIYSVVVLTLVHLRTRQRQVSQLERLNEELDGRVRQRTAELEASNDGLKREIAERERAEETLKAAHARLERISSSNMVGMVLADARGELQDVNDYYLNLLGFTRSEFEAGKIRWDERTPAEHLPADWRAIEELRERGICTPYEKEYIRKDGSLVWVLIADTLLPGPEEHILALVVDISEHKRADEELKKYRDHLEDLVGVRTGELKESEKKFRELYEGSRDGYVFVNMEGCIKEFNRAYREMLGYSEEELFRLTYQDLTPEKWHGMEARIINEEVLQRGFSDLYEKEYRRDDGTTFPVELRTYLVRDMNGTPSGMWAFIRDITERKQTEEEINKLNRELAHQILQLEAANKELEAFSYSVSHDLRAPLRAIDGFSRVVLEDCAEKVGDEGKRHLNIIRSNTQKMGQLIDDLLVFSRLGRQAIRISELDMEKMARDVFKEFEPVPPERKIQFDIGQLPSAHADPSMIRQVFTNLLSNAIKFTKTRETSIIRIGGLDTESEHLYSIKDNGVGFDMQYVNKLFGVFQRLHSSEEFEGTGVGLGIVQRIIHRHGGRVWAEGKVNEGAIFYFTLPRKKEEQYGDDKRS